MFNNILVPTDGSKLSQKAVQEAIQLAKVTGAKLVALHVHPKFSRSPYGTFGPSEDVIAEAHARQHKAEAEKLFAAIKKIAGPAGWIPHSSRAAISTSRSLRSPRRRSAISLGWPRTVAAICRASSSGAKRTRF